MSRLVNAELLKLRSTRTSLALIGSVVALVVLISLLATLTGDPADENFGGAKDRLGIAGFAQAFALVLGILAVTTEFRHGTITPTLIAAPDKTSLVLAKLVANVGAGLLLGLLAVGLCTTIVLVGFDARGIDTGLDGDEVTSIVIGQTLATGLWAALGVGLGALVRNQVGAIVGALVFTFVGEPLLGILPAGIGDAIQKWGPSGASNALGNLETENTGDLLGQLPGGLLLAGYALVFVVLGIVTLRRRDVTA
jgi:ABC-2 type transport system permease protein